MRTNTSWPVRKFTCPYCGAVSAFDCIFSVKGNFNGILYPVSVWSCHNCDRSIFIRNRQTEYEHEATNSMVIDSIYPTQEKFVDSHVPIGIANDFIEASKDYNIAAYKSSVVMARRTIQKTCLNLGATKTKKLYEQIEELKLSGKLHTDLADLATEIRFLGNDGAHPEDDGLDEISVEDAKEVLDFTAELLDDLYVRPEKVAAMKKKRESKV
jgi:transcription elongation factor Elf1